MTYEFLYQKYVIEDLTSREIARQLGLKSKTSVLRKLREFNLVKSGSAKRENKETNGRTYLYGKITKTLWCLLTSLARVRELFFDVNPKYLFELLEQQNYKCALSGREISIEFITSAKGKTKRTASLDRIDSSKGYIEGNVQWLHKDVNNIKQDFSQEEFLNLCKQITEYNK